MTVTARTGTTGTGAPAFAAPVRGVAARVDGRRRTVSTPTSDMVVCAATATVRPDVQVAKGSLVEHDGNVFEVLDVVDAVEYRRLHHRDLLLDGPRPGAA